MRKQNGPEPINDALKKHSRDLSDWQYQQMAKLLHEWAERFNNEFDLGLDTPAICIEPIGRRKYGTYCFGRNGFGVLHEITMNERHINRPLADILRTLLHELVHEWQNLFGKSGRNNYHNQQFQRKAALYGLIVDSRGHDLGVRAGRFTELLRRFGVDTAGLRSPEEQGRAKRPHGNPKMRKFDCGCTIVRCATDMSATCNKCHGQFLEAPPLW